MFLLMCAFWMKAARKKISHLIKFCNVFEILKVKHFMYPLMLWRLREDLLMGSAILTFCFFVFVLSLFLFWTWFFILCMYSGVKTSELDDLIAQTCAYMAGTHPDFSKNWRLEWLFPAYTKTNVRVNQRSRNTVVFLSGWRWALGAIVEQTNLQIYN